MPFGDNVRKTPVNKKNDTLRHTFISIIRGTNTLIVALFTFAIIFYQQLLSPLFPNKCRFTPRCSDYMIKALRTWGLLKGGWLGVKRILKCHPFGKWGYDPVPGKKDSDT